MSASSAATRTEQTHVPAITQATTAFYHRQSPAREVLQVGDMPVPEPGPGEVVRFLSNDDFTEEANQAAAADLAEALAAGDPRSPIAGPAGRRKLGAGVP